MKLQQPVQHPQPTAGDDVDGGTFEDALHGDERGLDQGRVGVLLGELGLDGGYGWFEFNEAVGG